MSLTTAHLNLIRTALDTIGAPLPKQVRAALADRDKLAALTPIPTVTGAEVADAVAACLLAGRDPLDDDNIRRLAIARALGSEGSGNMSYGVGQAADRLVAAALTEHAGAILAVLAAATAQHGTTLTRAHAILGDLSLDDSQAVLSLGPDAARCWAETREAVHVLRGVDRAWSSLAEVTRFASSSTPPVLRFAALTLEQYERTGRSADAWTLVQAGAVLELADGDSLRARDRSIAAELQERQVQAEVAFREAHRRTYGGVVIT